MSTTTLHKTTVTRQLPADDLPAETRRSTATLRRSDVFAIVGAAVAAATFTWLLFSHVAPLTGQLGFLVVCYVVFVGLYALLVSFDEKAAIVKDRLVAVAVHSLGALLLMVLVFILVFTFWRARSALPHWNFYTQDMQKAGPLDPLTAGGIKHAMVGTLEQISLALAFTVPVGIVCAVFLNELPGAFSRLVRTI